MAHRLQVGDDDQFHLPEGLLIRWVIAAVLGMLLLFLSLTLHIDESTPDLFIWLSLGINTLMLLLLGKEVFWVTYDEWKTKSFSLGTLIFIGVFSSYGLSVSNILKGADNTTYFETSGMILVFYIGSLLIDIYLKNKIGTYSKKWEAYVPNVIAKTSDGAYSRISAEALKVGDMIKSEVEKVIPVDGIVENQGGFVSEAHLTGEPTPVLKKTRDKVKAGSIALDEDIEIKLSSSYARSSLSSYFRQFEWEKKQLSSYEDIANRAASILLATVLVLAMLSLGFFLWSGDTGTAINNFLAVLIIGCPCAFAIATPAAIWISHKALHDEGVLLRTGSKAIERLSEVTHMIFDKTGTITAPANIHSVEVVDSTLLDDQKIKELLVGLESVDEHPIAKAVRKYGVKYEIKPQQITEIRKKKGLGIEGSWLDEKGKEHRVALLNRAHPMGKELEENVFALFLDGRIMLKIRIHHPLQTEAKDLLEYVAGQGYEVSVISGDPAAQDEMKNQNWTYIGNLSPDEKADYVQQKKESGDNILFVGDGLNDLMAMTKADCTIAMFEGSDKNKVEADIVFYNPNIKYLQFTVQKAKSTKKIIQQNFFWALIYNSIGLPLAATGFLSPLISIGAMILSSIFVTANSLRLKNAKKNTYDQ
ncbi:heavy metal translocating P-type ATPase [Gracilimonas sp.]|uniref:heavy metal translocating P-type ATPase n=1 Tax=Gracilimonas sp. TaxID=1974203 RepID=UPI0028720959|nr:HAD-IC family P-type ATPase [Gracilimonas sp.]